MEFIMIFNHKSLSKPKIYFNTIPIASHLGESKRYSVRACTAYAKSDKTIFEEAAEACSLNIGAKTLAYLFDAVLTTAVQKTAKDGIPRRIGDLLKVTPVLRGTLEESDGAFDPETCSCHIGILPLKEAKCKMMATNFQFINRAKETNEKKRKPSK